MNEEGRQLGEQEELQVGLKYRRSNTVKVKWDTRLGFHYDRNILENIFVKYGTVTGGNALVEFESPVAARMAIKETGHTDSKMKVKTLWKAECGDGIGVSDGVREPTGSTEDVESPKHACPACRKLYARRQHLKRHIMSAHSCTLEDLLPKKQFDCRKCTKSYSRFQYLTRHIQMQHAKQKESLPQKRVRPQLPKPSTKPLCEYEKMQRDNIRRNQLFLKSLDIEP